MPTIIIAIGVPASGKSSYYKNTICLTNLDYVYLSADAIRKELLGDENNQSQGNLIFKIFYQRLEQAIQNKKNIYIDNTNVTKKYRQEIIKRIKKYNNNYFIKALVFQAPFYKLIWRDFWRKKKVGYKIINKFLAKLELPNTNEGFHIIEYHK